MQLSFRQKEQLFHELEQLTRAGITFSQALKTVGRNSRSALGRSAQRLREAWEQTGSASQAFVAAGFGSSDAALIEAGAESGRLEQIFAEIGQSYALKAKARQTMISHTIYPLFIFHFGALISGVLPAVLAQSSTVFFKTVIPIFVGFYLLVFLAWGLRNLVGRLLNTEPRVAAFVQRIPFLGSFFTDWTGWNFAQVLSLYLKAGGGILEAVHAAGLSCGNAALRAQAEQTVAYVRHGDTLAEAFSRSDAAPEALARAIEIGEQTGRLDVETERAALLCKDRAIHRMERFAEWLPRLFYILIMLFMVWQIVKAVGLVGEVYSSALSGE